MKNRTLTNPSYEHMHLATELKATLNALESAYSVFENVTEPELIDCSIYQINAIQRRYAFLLDKARQYPSDISTKDLESFVAMNFKFHEFAQ
ncbi:MAG: YaaL family protein [Lachnospiraceae bacterium]|nr:YaaL family protein [Lachnospiraceae bacterium]